MRFSRQEYWSGSPFPIPGNLPDPGIEPKSLVSPILAGGFFTAEPLGKPMKSTTLKWGFPDSSVGKESVCNAGDPGLIPGSGGSAEEGIGYPLQYSWASLVAQLVKNLPITQKTWVQSLCWEDPLKGMATHCSILAWRIPQNIQSMGSQRVRHN